MQLIEMTLTMGSVEIEEEESTRRQSHCTEQNYHEPGQRIAGTSILDHLHPALG